MKTIAGSMLSNCPDVFGAGISFALSNEFFHLIKFSKHLLCGIVAMVILFCGQKSIAQGVVGLSDKPYNIASGETVIQRLKRLHYEAFDNEAGCVINMNNAVVILSNPKRESDGKVMQKAVKIFGALFIRQDEKGKSFIAQCQSAPTKHKMGNSYTYRSWSMRPFMIVKNWLFYEETFEADTSDKEFVNIISRVGATLLPIEIDAKYQTRWSILSAVIYLETIHDIKGNESFTKTDILDCVEPLLSGCPSGFAVAYRNLVDLCYGSNNRRKTSRTEEWGSGGALLGAMNSDNPQGGAAAGALIGGLLGLIADLDEVDSDVSKLRKAFDDVEYEARKVGVDLNDRSDRPYISKQSSQ